MTPSNKLQYNHKLLPNLSTFKTTFPLSDSRDQQWGNEHKLGSGLQSIPWTKPTLGTFQGTLKD